MVTTMLTETHSRRKSFLKENLELLEICSNLAMRVFSLQSLIERNNGLLPRGLDNPLLQDMVALSNRWSNILVDSKEGK